MNLRLLGLCASAAVMTLGLLFSTASLAQQGGSTNGIGFSSNYLYNNFQTAKFPHRDKATNFFKVVTLPCENSHGKPKDCGQKPNVMVTLQYTGAGTNSKSNVLAYLPYDTPGGVWVPLPLNSSGAPITSFGPDHKVYFIYDDPASNYPAICYSSTIEAGKTVYLSWPPQGQPVGECLTKARQFLLTGLGQNVGTGWTGAIYAITDTGNWKRAGWGVKDTPTCKSTPNAPGCQGWITHILPGSGNNSVVKWNWTHFAGCCCPGPGISQCHDCGGFYEESNATSPPSGNDPVVTLFKEVTGGGYNLGPFGGDACNG